MAGFYGINEYENEFLRCVDPVTNGIIYCVNKIHLETDGWCKKWISNDIVIIDVRKVKPFQSSAFTHDSWVDRHKTSKFVDMLIDFACLIHANLKRFGKVIVHCKNGRSRSPTVILAFMMLRGLSKEHATSWLTTAFRSQRITIASRSVEFPNFPKFESVISALAIRCSTESSRLEIDKRVEHNFNTFSSTSSSSSSSSLNHLNGLPFSGSWLVPERLKGKLPSTSFCSAPSTMSISKSDSSSATKGGRTSRRQRKQTVNSDAMIGLSCKEYNMTFALDKTYALQQTNKKRKKAHVAIKVEDEQILFPRRQRKKTESSDAMIGLSCKEYNMTFAIDRTYALQQKIKIKEKEDAKQRLDLDLKKKKQKSVFNNSSYANSTFEQHSLIEQTLISDCESDDNKGSNDEESNDEVESDQEMRSDDDDDDKETEAGQKKRRFRVRQRMKSTSTNYIGVSERWNGFIARMWVVGEGKRNGKEIHIGTYETPKDAAIAHDYAILKNKQSTTLLNFPDMKHNLDVELKRTKKKLQSNNTTGYRGVTFRFGKFKSRITIDGKKKALGTFDNAIDAAIAYDQAATLIGRLSFTLNFPDFPELSYSRHIHTVSFTYDGLPIIQLDPVASLRMKHFILGGISGAPYRTLLRDPAVQEIVPDEHK